MKRVLRAIGPWQFQPLVLAVIMFAMSATYVAGTYTAENLFRSFAIFTVVFPAILAGAAVYLVLALGKRWQLRHGVRWSSYLIVLLFAAIPVALIRIVINHTTENGTADNFTLVGGVIRIFLGLCLAMAVVGSVTNRLQRQITLTEDALELAQRQQIQIIAADEEARRQTSALLHDRVQAGLLSSCLELQQFKGSLPMASIEQLQPIIDRLEALRSLDVRSAARALSPNLVDVDLQTAIEELAMQYETHLVVSVRVSPDIDRDRTQLGQMVLLGVYRIVEQALLNAAVHAHASEVEVVVSRSADECHVTVTDDGIGLQGEPGRGTGATLIDTWTRSLNGAWHWEPNPAGNGTQLVASVHKPE